MRMDLHSFTACRRLSCEACFSVTDSGLQSLSTCPNLTDLTVSYCKVQCMIVSSLSMLFIHSQLSDSGLHSVAVLGVLRRLVVRACSQLTSKGACHRVFDKISHTC